MKTSFFKRNKKTVFVGGLVFGLLALASLVYAATGNPCRLYSNGTDQKTGNHFSGTLPSGWSLLRQVCKRSESNVGASILSTESYYGSNIATTNHLNKDVHIPFAKKRELIKFIQATRDSDSALFVGNGYVNTMHPSGGANPGLPQGVQLCAEGQSDPLVIEEATTPILGYTCGGTYETSLPGSCEGTYNRYSHSCTGETFESSEASCSGTLAGIPDASSFGPPTINPGQSCSEVNIFEESTCSQVAGCEWQGNHCAGEIPCETQNAA